MQHIAVEDGLSAIISGDSTFATTLTCFHQGKVEPIVCIVHSLEDSDTLQFALDAFAYRSCSGAVRDVWPCQGNCAEEYSSGR